jgi:hypothetical protein
MSLFNVKGGKTSLAEKMFSEKSTLYGNWVAVMDHERHERALTLSSFRTRCFKQGEIHEFLLCDRDTAKLKLINDVAYLGFGAFTQGGVVEVGDEFWCGDNCIGSILGFDETHMPNHYNVIIQSEQATSGFQRGLRQQEAFSIKMQAR